MNEEQNACAEPIGQALRRHGVPESLVGHIDEVIRRAAKDREALKFELREKPRTIVLAYTPRMLEGSRERDLDGGEADGCWTVHEGGRAQAALDSRETLALVAAMLLGAPHPPLRSHWALESEARRTRRDIRTALDTNADLMEEKARNVGEIEHLRGLHGSLPWELANSLFAELRGPKVTPEDGREAFLVPLLELARRMAPGKVEPLPDTPREPPRIVEIEFPIDRAVAEAFGDAFKLRADQTLTVDFTCGLGTFRMTGVPHFPTDASYTVATTYAPSPEALKMGGERMADLAFGDHPAPCGGKTSADLKREATAAAVEEELQDLADALAECGYPRGVEELAEWPVGWRIDAQNFASAWLEWAAGGLDVDKEPKAPAFMTGGVPVDLEAAAAREHAGFGLEPPGLDLAPPSDSVLGAAIASTAGSPPAVPRSLVDGGPPAE